MRVLTPSQKNLCQLNDSSLIDRVAELAAQLTPVSDIAAILDIDEDDLRMALADKGSDIRKAYMKARAETALMLRNQEIQLAKLGSPLAVQMTSSYLRQMDNDIDY